MPLDTDPSKDTHTDMDMDMYADTATDCDMTDQEQERPTAWEPKSTVSDGCILADALRRTGVHDQTSTSSFTGEGEQEKQVKRIGDTDRTIASLTGNDVDEWS